MTQIEIFNKFKHKYSQFKMSINTFVQLKHLYVKPIIIHDTCCCHYHVEFELYYDTFLDFSKTLWSSSPPASTFCAFIYEIICEREGDELFYQKRNFDGKKCNRCGNLSLFHSKYPIDMKDLSFSNITINWKRYE